MNLEYELGYWIFHWVGAFIVFAFGAIGYAIGHVIGDDLSKRIGCMCIVSSFVWEIWVLIIFVLALCFLIEEWKNWKEAT